MMSVGTVHAIMESRASRLSSGTVMLILTGFSLWGVGGSLMDYVTCPEETRLAPFRYVSMLVMLFLLAFANRFLTPIMTVCLLSACSLLLVFIDERIHLKTPACEDLRTKE
jgi:hypothetical protein